MPEHVQAENPPSMTSLMSGIIDDAQRLIRQEVALARQEVKEDVNKAITAAVSFGIGAVVSVVGTWMVCLMLVYLLYWLSGGDRTGAAIPLWGCYGIVALVFICIGVALFYVAKSKASQIDVIPRQTVETMKENVQWIKNQT